MYPLTILTADHSPLYRKAVEIAAKELATPVRLLEADCFHEIGQRIGMEDHVDLLIVDMELADLQTPEQLRKLLRKHPVPMAMTAARADRSSMHWAQASGAMGLLAKCLEPKQFTEALQHVLAGEHWYPEFDGSGGFHVQVQEKVAFRYLSSSELRVIGRVRDGWKNKQIADQLHLSECTIKSHLTSAFRKLQIDNRTQLATIAMQWPNLK